MKRSTGSPICFGYPAGQDVTEVAGRDAEVHLLARCYQPGVDKVAVGGEIIRYLRQQPAPVDGVGRGQEPAVSLQLGGELPVGEDSLHARLGVVKVALHGADADVVPALRYHLEPLHVADAVARIEDHIRVPGTSAKPSRAALPVSPLVATSMHTPRDTPCFFSDAVSRCGSICSAMSLKALVGPCQSSR